MTLRRLAFALVVTCAACPRSATPPEAPSNEPTGEPLVEGPPESVPPPTAALSGGQIVLSEPIQFEAGGDRLAAQTEGVLGAIADLLRTRVDLTLVRIEGHSDSQGAEQANQDMSEQRAYTIARWLVGNGIACDRLIAVGFGETKPIADNRTADGRAQNSRMEFHAAALRGHPIGGLPVDGGGQVARDPCQ